MLSVNIKNQFFSKKSEKVLTFRALGDIIYKQRGTKRSQYAGMAELADARDLKSREIFSRTGSTPASGTIISRSGAVW